MIRTDKQEKEGIKMIQLISSHIKDNTIIQSESSCHLMFGWKKSLHCMSSSSSHITTILSFMVENCWPCNCKTIYSESDISDIKGKIVSGKKFQHEHKLGTLPNYKLLNSFSRTYNW